jgi:hypothetical protein
VAGGEEDEGLCGLHPGGVAFVRFAKSDCAFSCGSAPTPPSHRDAPAGIHGSWAMGASSTMSQPGSPTASPLGARIASTPTLARMSRRRSAGSSWRAATLLAQGCRSFKLAYSGFTGACLFVGRPSAGSSQCPPNVPMPHPVRREVVRASW